MKNFSILFLKSYFNMNLVNNKIKKITKHDHLIFTSNCTTAIYLLLKALKFEKKKIIVPINICFDVILSILYSNNIPLVIDTNEKLGLCISDLKKKINKKKNIGAIIFPYLYGNSDNFLKVQNLIKSKNIPLIEDIAGAFGGKIKDRYFGSFGDYTVGSFGQGKIIDMLGGGFVSTNDKNIFLDINKNYHLLKNYNLKNKEKFKKLNKLQSKILSKKEKTLLNENKIKFFIDGFIYNKKFNKKYFYKLNNKIKDIDKINKKRNKKATYYDKIFNFDFISSIVHKKGSVYWRKNFLINEGDSSQLINKFNEKKFYARKYYPPLNYIFKFLEKKTFRYEKSYRKLINFWVGEELEQNHIIEAKKIFFNFKNFN